jgi:hypothetical protein
MHDATEHTDDRGETIPAQHYPACNERCYGDSHWLEGSADVVQLRNEGVLEWSETRGITGFVDSEG